MTPDRETLARLLQDVEAATEGSRGLDEGIAVELLGWCLHKNVKWTGWQDDTGVRCLECGADSWGNRSKNGLSQRYHDGPPQVTRSTDDASALVERVLPDGLPLIEKVAANRWSAGIQVPTTGGALLPFVQAPTPSLALIAALLRALMEQADAHR